MKVYKSFIGFKAPPELRQRIDQAADGNLSLFIRESIEQRLDRERKNKKAAKLSQGSGSLFGNTSR